MPLSSPRGMFILLGCLLALPDHMSARRHQGSVAVQEARAGMDENPAVLLEEAKSEEAAAMLEEQPGTIEDGSRPHVAFLINGQERTFLSQQCWESLKSHVMDVMKKDASVSTYICLQTRSETSFAGIQLPSNIRTDDKGPISGGNPPSDEIGRMLIDLSVKGITFSEGGQWGKIDSCYNFALGGSGAKQFDRVVLSRPDVFWFADMPRLQDLDAHVLHSRTRMRVDAITPDGVPGDRLSFGGDCMFPSSMCEHDQGVMREHKVPQCAVFDDQFVVIPGALAPGVLKLQPSPEDIESMSKESIEAKGWTYGDVYTREKKQLDLGEYICVEILNHARRIVEGGCPEALWSGRIWKWLIPFNIDHGFKFSITEKESIEGKTCGTNLRHAGYHSYLHDTLQYKQCPSAISGHEEHPRVSSDSMMFTREGTHSELEQTAPAHDSSSQAEGDGSPSAEPKGAADVDMDGATDSPPVSQQTYTQPIYTRILQ